jgi:hypothetical protein
MEVTVRQVICRRDLREFIFLPEKVHAQHRNWLPPVYRDEWSYFNPKKNKAFAECDSILLLALRGSEIVGRIMGIIHPRHNLLKFEKNARFACLESFEDDDAVMKPLLESVENWARVKGMEKMVGPFGLSDQDPSGFLIEGFEHPPTISTYYNYEWIPGALERQGYRKEVDYVTYRIEVPADFPDRYHRMYERILARGRLEILRIRSRKEAEAWAKHAFRLMNESYADEEIYGFSPMEREEMEFLLRRYMSILDPRFLFGIKKRNDLVGFVAGVPDFSAGIRNARGRLFPFGFLKILLSMRRATQLVLLLGAIKKEYRGLGIDLLLMLEMWMSARKAGMRVVDTHHQMETNRKMRAVSEWLGGTVYKRHRVYRKDLGKNMSGS